MISIIIPTYNRAKTIERAVSSVLTQTIGEIECIVVDDCSTDNTQEIIRSIDDDRVVYIRHERNKNASVARNTGIELAKGEYFAFQDSDDEWLPTKLEKQLALMESLPGDYGLVYCWQDYYDGEKLIHEHHKSNRGNIFPKVLARIMTGGTQTLFIRREVLDRVGGFDERITNGDDQDFIRRIAQRYKVDLVPEVLVKVYINHGSGERLSDPKVEKNNLDYIDSRKLELKKFKRVLFTRPDLKASIYKDIAYHYALVGNKKGFFKNNSTAWLLWPWQGRIKSTLRGIRQLFS